MSGPRRAAALLAMVAASVALGGSALAASPGPTPASESPIVQYTGVSTYTNTTSGHVGTAQTTATIDCSESPCVLTVLHGVNETGYSYDALGGSRRIPVVMGRADVQLAAAGDLCGSYWIGAGRLTLSPGSTPGSLHLTRTTAESGEQCNGTAEWDGLSIQGDITPQSGSFCLVDGDCPTATPTPVASSRPVLAAGGPGGGPARGLPHAVQAADPSTLSVLPTVATALTPANIVWAAAATVVLVLLISLPSHLLNSATEAGTDRFSEWWARTRRRLRVAPEASATPAKTPATKPVEFAGWPLAAAGVLAASVISSFIDPSFGFNAASIRVFGSILLSFLLDAVLGWFLLILLVRRANPHATARLRFAPASLVVVVIAVLFTRLTGFQPGIVFGLVAGVVFGAIVAGAEKARLALISLGYSFVLAVIGWIGYSALTASIAHPSAAVVFVEETLSAMAIGGIAALPIALVPLRGLAGYEIWNWNRWVWAGGYVIGLLGFLVVLMPKPFSWATVGLSVWTWGGIFAAYSVAAVVLWLVIARPWRREEETSADETSADETGAQVTIERSHVQSPDGAASA